MAIDRALYFSGGRSVVFSELFFWSSNNQNEFKERYGELWKSPHLNFCTEKNELLLQEYRPKAVIFVGLGPAVRLATFFALTHIDTLNDGTHRLVEYYHDNNRPWFFTKHWTGAFGFSKVQMDAIKHYIDKNL
jgi:hypothetical protein